MSLINANVHALGRSARSLLGTAGRFVCFAFVTVLFVSAPAFALAPYTEPLGYPTAWPPQLETTPYTRLGVPEVDRTGNPDLSTGAAPAGAADFSSGAAGDQTSFFYYGNGSVLYFRFRLDGPPMALTGQGQPFTSATWNVLLDIDGDGYKEFVVMLDGTSNAPIPDDIVIIYENVNSQSFVISQTGIWRQDCAGPNDGEDGASGFSSNWDLDTDAFVWDFGRTRVVQIDRTKPVASNNSEYFIDIQVPIQAFDATGIDGPALSASGFFSLAATTSNSNTDPTQKDLLYNGDFALADVPLPGGDIYNGYGTRIDAPIIAELTQTGCPSPDTLKARVSDVMNVVGGLTTDTIDSVWFEVYYDYNGNWGEDDPGQTWTRIGAGTRISIGYFRFIWDVSQASAGNFLIRAVARDKQNNTTYSTSNPAGTTYLVAKFTNTCSTVPVLTTSNKTVSDLNGGQAVPGDTLLYTITVRNTGGGNATTVVLKDTIPTYSTYVPNSASPTPAATSPALTWNLSTLNAGDSSSYAFKATINSPIPNGTTIENKGMITASNAPEKQVTASISVTSLPLATCSKSVNKANAAPGDTLVYTINYGNNGTDAATFLIVSDTVPIRTDYVPNSVTLNGFAKTDISGDDQVTVSGSDIMVTVGTVAAGGSGTITFRVKVK